MKFKPSQWMGRMLACAFFFSIGWNATCWAQEQSNKSKPEQVACGTKLNWYSQASEAKKVAQKKGKPMVILHLSGDFKNESFT